MRPLIILILLCSTFITFAQEDYAKTFAKLGKNPLIIIDNIESKVQKLAQYEPEEIAVFSVFYDTTATNQYGEKAKDGVIIIETKTFAKNIFITHIRSMSSEFNKLYESNPDSLFAFIHHDQVLIENYEGKLSLLATQKQITGLEIISNKQLQKIFGPNRKRYGVIILSAEPEKPKMTTPSTLN